MTDLAEHVFNCLVDIVGEDALTLEQVQEAVSSFETPKKSAKKTTAKKTAEKASKVPETFTCDYVINGKDGNQRVCGKNAKNELDDCHYCGTEKSGCYKSMLGKAAAAPTAKKAKSAKVTKAATSKVVQKVIKTAKINLNEVPSGSGVWVDLKNHRMVYTQDPREAYGILDDDDETILPLTEEAATFAEVHNINIRAKKAAKKAPAGKTVAKTPAKSVKASSAKTAPAKATPAKAAKASKAVPVQKGKTKKNVSEEEEILVEEEAENVEEEEGEEVEIDLGEEEPQEAEAVDDEEPDIEEVDEEGGDDEVEEEEVEEEGEE